MDVCLRDRRFRAEIPTSSTAQSVPAQGLSPRSERLACESPRFRPHGGGGIPATSPLMANPRPRTLPPLLRDPPPALTCPPLALRRANGAPSPPALLASFVPTLCHRAASTVGSLTGAARSLCTVRTSACSSECRHRMRARALGRGRPCRHLGLAPLATPFRYRSAISATWVLLVIRLRSLTLSLLSQTSVRRL